MRKTVIGLLALIAGLYTWLRTTPAIGPGLFEIHWSALSQVEWPRVWPPHLGFPHLGFCAFLVAAGLILILKGVEELHDD